MPKIKIDKGADGSGLLEDFFLNRVRKPSGLSVPNSQLEQIWVIEISISLFLSAPN